MPHPDEEEPRITDRLLCRMAVAGRVGLTQPLHLAPSPSRRDRSPYNRHTRWLPAEWMAANATERKLPSHVTALFQRAGELGVIDKRPRRESQLCGLGTAESKAS